MLEVIYVVRHGYRSNWTVDPSTGHYNSTIPSPTGIVADPALASYGVQQAQQLGQHLLNLQPPVDLIYSSPFYRCIQTLQPYTTAQASATGTPIPIHLDRGIGEFYGRARFDHPSPAPLSVLSQHFPHLIGEDEGKAAIIPSKNGESIPQLHDRIAYALNHIIVRADAHPDEPKSLLICTHAAAMIAIGRTLTGQMPEEEGEEDFKCFTCAFSKFVRRPVSKFTGGGVGGQLAEKWEAERPDAVPDVGWRGGRGVGGGWDCVVNGDCSFLSGGEERGWNFEMEKEQFKMEYGKEPDTLGPVPTAEQQVVASTTIKEDGEGKNDRV